MAVIKIFVSHSHADDDFCHEYVSLLRKAGADVWYDEHNLGTGELHEVIPRELGNRPVFIVILSKAAFRSSWVKDETKWAYNLFKRQPSRIIMPVTAQTISQRDFNEWLFLEDFKRIEKPGFEPYTPRIAAQRTIKALSIDGSAPSHGTQHLAIAGTDEEIITHGKALQAQERLSEALEYWEAAAARSSDSYQVWFNFGVTLFQLNRLGDALNAFKQAFLINPSSVEALNNMGLILVRLKRTPEALKAYSDAVMFDNQYFNAWYNLGNLLLGLKRYSKAIVVFKKCVEIDKSSARSWNNLGVALSGLKRYTEAADAFHEAVRLAGKCPKYWSNLTSVLEIMGRTSEAEVANFKAQRYRLDR